GRFLPSRGEEGHRAGNLPASSRKDRRAREIFADLREAPRAPLRPSGGAGKDSASPHPFSAERRGGNAVFPAFRSAGEQGRPRSLLSRGRERRKVDAESFPEEMRRGNASFPALPAKGERGTSRS